MLSGKGGAIVLTPGQTATYGEAVWANYDTVYEVDMGQHELQFTASAPARGGDVSFKVAFSCGYRVSDPAAVVDSKLQDPTAMLTRALREIISQITPQFDIEKGEDAAAAIRKELVNKKATEALPFTLDTPHVTVELDQDAREFLKKRREQLRQAELARSSSELTTATAQAKQLEREYELRGQKREQEFELELAQRKVQMELELQKMRLEVYKPMIDGGMWTVLAQQLAQNPNDISKVTDVIMQMHGRKVEADLLLLKTLIDGDIIEDRQIREVANSLMRNLEQSMRTGGLPSGAAQLTAKKDQKTKPDTDAAEDDAQ